jgi:hypothetical protein
VTATRDYLEASTSCPLSELRIRRYEGFKVRDII